VSPLILNAILNHSLSQPSHIRKRQRSEDYYNEGLLIWLDVNSLIRELSRGRSSLDDFARAFFGVNDGDWGELTYTFEDVVLTLNEVQNNDWVSFFRARVESVSDHAPLDGFVRGGYPG
jgi:predicted metalloprotease with PDZ domain